MSGHSKWANIKRKKAANDKVKSNVFGKLAHLITLAVVEGGAPDPENNVRLRLVIDKAKMANMPKDNIKRAIDRASGPEKNAIKQIIYEGFAPYKVLLIILATTDNPNRSISEVRNIMERHNGKLGNNGSVSYMFKKCSLLVIDKNQITEEQVFEISDKLGAFDMVDEDDNYFVYFPFENLGHTKSILNNIAYKSLDIHFKALTEAEVNEQEANQILSLIEELENLDDVHAVFSNL